MADFTHFNDQGRARMVDVGEKDVTHREAVAAARVLVNRETFDLIRSGGVKKGDVLTVAQVAGIMGAKRTPELIPMCHPVQISGVDLRLTLDETRCSVEITASVRCDGRTGVEMEALTAVSAAALTVYDMCKAVQRDMVITDVRLLSKTGGVHGTFQREESILSIQPPSSPSATSARAANGWTPAGRCSARFWRRTNVRSCSGRSSPMRKNRSRPRSATLRTSCACSSS